MEKCPHCEQLSIEPKKKLALSPKDVLLCPNCGTKLALGSYTYFIHATLMMIVGFSLFKLSIPLGILAIVLSSALALVLIIKVVPFKIVQ